MNTSFLEDASNAPTVLAAADCPLLSDPRRESVRLLAIGSPSGVRAVIYRLHQLGFAEVGAWSRLLPTANPGEVMSILTWTAWVE